MPDHWPTLVIVGNELDEKIVWVHVCTLTDVHLVLILDEPAEDLEEGCDVEQLRADVQVSVVLEGLEVIFFVALDPLLIVLLDDG